MANSFLPARDVPSTVPPASGEVAATRPFDWPGPGPIDLSVHDLPHASSTLEWWYLNCHVETASGRELSLFAAFFRQAYGADEAGKLEYAHSVSFAVCDVAEERYHPKVVVDAGAPKLGLKKLASGSDGQDPRLSRALREVLERGQMPLPTQTLNAQAVVASDRLNLAYGRNRLEKTPAGTYRLELFDEQRGFACALSFTPKKPALRHGDAGVVHGIADELMFYYFVPRCEVVGTLELSDETETSVRGIGWYDHEFGRPLRAPGATPLGAAAAETSWRWASVQLADGTDVSFFRVSRRATGEELDNWTVVSAPGEAACTFRGATLEVLSTWQSRRSFVEYPTRFRLLVAEAELELELCAAFPDQEVLTVISDPGFWEGRVSVTGTLFGRAVTGRGWVECKGFRFQSMGAFFDAVGKQVRGQLANLLPERPDATQLPYLVVRGDGEGTDAERYLDGVSADALGRALTRPLRTISDRGGKGWRSYAALACIDVVGGDSRKFAHWLPMPELLHVGSLIVDDVEDDSEIRRGGASCHRLHGANRALNAGTAAYFLAEPPIHQDDLPAEVKLRVYRLYFDALRAGHAGQALDLEGFDDEAARAVESGDTTLLERRVLAMHRLKTAAPAGMMARVGAILGGGSATQVEALGRFFEAVGLAFQIMDDVLNLRGFERDLKQRGEDVRQGKLTLPIARALAGLPEAERRWLWLSVKAKPQAPREVDQIIGVVEGCGALDDCARLAREQVERAWGALDPVLKDSQAKLTFRAFSWYVLERHY